MSFPSDRPRRLRRTASMRGAVGETDLSVRHLVAPLFVKEGIARPEPVASMPGHSQHTLESLAKEARELHELGVQSFLLFGIPASKDAEGSAAADPAGISQAGLRALTDELGEQASVVADLCMCEYTDHGHCGILRGEHVDNDATLARYAEIAVAQAAAGADVVAPSGMMDGQVGVIRDALDEAGHHDVAIMAYAAKFASAMYGPFRDAAECAPQFGDRASYQMDPGNVREAVREALLDESEGADVLMVKPALVYLDVIRAVREATLLPVAAYNVSGEYAMVKAAAANGWIDGERAALECVTAIRRAGAGLVITYFARELAERL